MKKLLLLFMITLLPVLGNAQTLIDGIYYNLNSSDNTASVTNNSNSYYSGRIVIPEQVFYEGITYSVTSIDDNAFNNCTNLTNVSISNSVTSIGKGAFGKTSLRTLIVGTGVLQFNSQAFSGATQPIRTIWLSNTPSQNYSVAQGIVNYVANSQYGSLNNKIEYKYLSSLFNVDGVTYVPVSPSERTCDAIDCIYDELKTEVNINTSVNYQGIDMIVMNVQPYTFYQNPYLQKVNLDVSGRVSQYALSNCQNLQIALLGNNVTNIDDYAFNNCQKLESIIIPDAVNAIGQYAFSGCSDMASVYIGDGASTIGQYAFSNCLNLTSINLGNKTRLIQQYAFSGCSSLPNITIPGSVHFIDNYAFDGCTALKEVVMAEHIGEVVTTSFDDCSLSNNSTKTYYKIVLSFMAHEGDEVSFDYVVNEGTLNINDGDKIDTPSGANPVRSGNYKKIITRSGLFVVTYTLGKLCKISNIKLIDSDILAMGSYIFKDCPLDSIYVNRKISNNNSPFDSNTTLRSVVITDIAEKIPEKEFFGCINLQDVQIGNGVTTIGDWAFSGCSSLKSFSFGINVSNIGKETFSDCTALTQLISHAATPPICGDQALDDINKWTCKLFVPKGCIGAYQAADQWKEFFFIEEGEKPNAEIAINEENFPDENFRAYLMSQSYGIDGIITEEEIKNVVEIFVCGRQITNLKGIEYFFALTKLWCYENLLTSLNVSGCTTLTHLDCHSNQLSCLDVSGCTALTELCCYNNQLTSLDVSKNTALTHLYCKNNQLTSLDVSKNSALTALDCYNNQLMSLDMSKNTALIELNCRENQLTSLDVSTCTALTHLDCYSNQLSILDVSGCTVLTELYCGDNQLTSLDVSKNTTLTELWCNNNQLKGLDMSKNTALMKLNCHENQLTCLDASKNTALTKLACYYNQLTSLDVSKNTALTWLSCGNNQLTSLDVSKNMTLTELWCNNNHLTSLDVSKNTALTRFGCYDNKINGEAMDALVRSLLNQAYYAEMYVIDLSNSSEENVCTKIQVNIAKEKGWRVLTSSGDDYEGTAPMVVQGDANNDGLVDANEIADIVNYMMGKPTSTGMFDVQAADMNKDGVVNIADIVQIVNIIMGK